MAAWLSIFIVSSLLGWATELVPGRPLFEIEFLGSSAAGLSQLAHGQRPPAVVVQLPDTAVFRKTDDYLLRYTLAIDVTGDCDLHKCQIIRAGC
jgi:hypothetical protein